MQPISCLIMYDLSNNKLKKIGMKLFMCYNK